MDVITLPTGQLKENCYLLTKKDICIIVDPGDEADFISSKIEEMSLEPEAIFLTHGHFDHAMAAEELRLIYKVPVIMHRADMFLIDRITETSEHYVDRHDVLKPKIDILLDVEKELEILNMKFKIIKTPGHTPGSISLYSKSIGVVFVGDLMFADGEVGRYDFSYCNKKDLYSSIKKIISLPPETVICPGHGEATTVQEEKHYFSQK